MAADSRFKHLAYESKMTCAPSVGRHYIKTMRVAQFVNLMKIRQL